jgi:ubiquinone/menaquinone biosynthesis C-methylase UbiE
MPGPLVGLVVRTGIVTRALIDHDPARTVVGVDLSRAMLKHAHAAAPTAILLRADAAALPFDNAVFGAVVNLAAIDLYPDADQVLGESTRVLARGGRWVCSTFVAEDRQSRRLAPFSSTRARTLAELASKAKRAGLGRFDCVRFHRYVLAWADRV